MNGLGTLAENPAESILWSQVVVRLIYILRVIIDYSYSAECVYQMTSLITFFIFNCEKFILLEIFVAKDRY